MNSQKTVVDKLNLTKYQSRLILGLPGDVHDFSEIEFDTAIKKEQYDMCFFFVFSLEEFSKQIKLVIEKKLLKDKGYLFFAYPKKNNPKYKEYIERDSIFPGLGVDEEGYVAGSDIKFARMVSLNDVFTVVGLKSEPKKAKKAASSKASQCVDDYIDKVEDILQHLNQKEELLKFYNELTPGYQKDWARYIYSAKRKETQEKRLLEMETLLGEGFKSIEHYRRENR